jgi:hypothetical protein
MLTVGIDVNHAAMEDSCGDDSTEMPERQLVMPVKGIMVLMLGMQRPCGCGAIVGIKSMEDVGVGSA